MKPLARSVVSVLFAALLLVAGFHSAHAEERIVIPVTLTENGFQPDVLNVPAGKRLKIEMLNSTGKVVELESFDMKFEKIASPGAKISVFTGPLRPGTYSFFDDYSVNGVKGTLIAEEQ